MLLQLEVRRDSSDQERKNPDYIDGIVVTLMLGVEVGRSSSSERQFEFNDAEANLVSLPEGRHIVRFYLPPEVVERDRIGQQVHSYLDSVVARRACSWGVGFAELGTSKR